MGRAIEIKLGGAREGAKMQCYVAVSQEWFFLALFLESVMNKLMFNLSHYLTIRKSLG